MKNETDNRVVSKHRTWIEYIAVFFVLSVLSMGYALVEAFYFGINNKPFNYILLSMGYWAIVSLIFCAVTNWQISVVYERPMRRLGEAAKRVANGDFSVWVEPVYMGKAKDYIDVMFEDFNKMVEELGSIETLKNDFISNVSHEIKTPIAVIQNYATALKRENITPEQRDEYADTIMMAGEKLTTLVTNILKLNKLENTEIIQESEPYDLCKQLCNCIFAYGDLMEEKNIELEADIEDRLTINADESMLDIVWNNLLSNALKFTDTGGKITLKETSDSDVVTVSITDTGSGMSDETMKHIFEKFYQGDSSHSQEGNGLGLALVMRVIDLIGGEISVKSTQGVGTTFTVKLKML